MALLSYTSGCKVAWETHDNEDEAKAAASKAKVEVERKERLGYDFGYQVPGSISHVLNHPEHGECWVVVLP